MPADPMRQFSERRDFLRMPIDCELSFSLLDSPGSYQGRVVNLSNGGILFTTENAVGAGARLEIELTPANSITPPMRARVTVSRVEARGGIYEIACKIDDDAS